MQQRGDTQELVADPLPLSRPKTARYPLAVIFFREERQQAAQRVHDAPRPLRDDMAPVVVLRYPCIETIPVQLAGKQNRRVGEIGETEPGGPVAKVEGYAVAHAVDHVLESLLAVDGNGEVAEGLPAGETKAAQI